MSSDDHSAARVQHIDSASRYWIKRSWTGLWWVAIDPDEPLAMIEGHTYYRAWTQDRLLAKLRRLNESKADPWREVHTRDLFA